MHGRAAFRITSTLVVFAMLLGGCGGQAGDDALSVDLQEGSIARLFEALASHFRGKAEIDVSVAPSSPFVPPETKDLAVEDLFATMGASEIDARGGDTLDGALVGLFQHQASPEDPSDTDDEVCFFARAEDDQPTAETLFWLEFYGFRSDDGRVADIRGHSIDLEVVGGENVGGDETRVIFYVNGILTSPDEQCDTLQSIADDTGAVVVGVMNESEGFLRDTWQTAWDRLTLDVERTLTSWGIDAIDAIHQNHAAAVLTNVIVQRVRAGKHVELWGHSQGGAIVSLALHRAARQLEREGLWPITRDGTPVEDAIRVVSLGSAAPVWLPGEVPRGPRYEHYIHLRDVTPVLFGLGTLSNFETLGKARSGGYASVTFFDGEPETSEPLREYDDKTFENLSLRDLAPEHFHGMTDPYLRMYTQKRGGWSD